MLTTDLALRFDPAYEKISRRFYEHPDQFADAFARAWFKLTHRDMGPIARYLGPLVPKETLIWQDPIPAVDHPLIDEKDIAALRRRSSPRACRSPQLVSTAWASASTFRGSDKRGGANGARIRLAPQKDWEVNQPAAACEGAAKLEAIQKEFNGSAAGGKKVSLADLIVLGGGAAIEKAAKAAGHDVKVAFTPGRMDASQEADRRAFLRPARAARRRFPQLFRSSEHHGAGGSAGGPGAVADADRAGDDGPPRRLARARRERREVRARRLHQASPETLTNDFFVNLLDMSTEWKPAQGKDGVYEGRDRKTKAVKWTGTRVDLIFGSHSSLAGAGRGLCAAPTRRRSSSRTSPRLGPR